jgi:uncharacterized protein
MSDSASRRNFLAAGLAAPVIKPLSSSLAPAPSFEYRVLGKTGLKVASVGFGCMITSDSSVVERAADLGITYFDTARGYQQGNNERMVGAALKGKRKNLTLSSKSQGKTKAEALEHLDTSLTELGTDHLDIWYLHAKSKPEEITDELIEAQQIAKKAGKIRFAGVSTHANQATLIPFLARHEKIDVILSAYNFTMEPAITAALEEAARAGKGVVGMKIMAGGSGEGRRGAPNPNAAKLKQPGALAAALRWVIRNKFIHTTIPSMTDMEQLDENVRAGVQSFSGDDAKLLAVRREQMRPYYCNMCGRCEGQCRYGLPVQDVLRFATYADGYGQFALGRERFLEMPDEHTSVRCSSCEGCTVQCPHGVRVADRLIRAQELFAC